jgi:hypothetical protein
MAYRKQPTWLWKALVDEYSSEVHWARGARRLFESLNEVQVNSQRILKALLLLTVILTMRADALPGRLPDLEKITEESDLILMGQLVSVQRAVRRASIDSADIEARWGLVVGVPEVPVRVDRGTLRVTDVLKGEHSSSSFTFDFLVPDVFIGWAVPSEGARGLFFFRASEGGALEYTDPYFPGIPTAQDLYSRGNTPVERVINALGDVIDSPASGPAEVSTAILWLQFSESEAARTVLRSALSHPDPERSLRAAGALASQGDVTGLDVIERAFLYGGPLPEDLEQAIPGLVMSVSDPAAIPELEELMQSRLVEMRRGAAFALGRTRSPDAIDALHQALQDADFDVRYYAATGLADITGQNGWRPSREDFASNEERYLSHWDEEQSR